MAVEKNKTVLPVVIVESHQHALEHVHFMLRKLKLCLSSKWTLIHYDSHPDLACPENIPARLCFTPRPAQESSLYDRLDETSTGIAEWILPLCLAANLETIHWIKQDFCQQLPLGEHSFRVGVEEDATRPIDSFLDLSEDAVLKVDWEHAYYLDDDMFAQNLQLSKPVLLTVREVNDENGGGVTEVSTEPWILDICLDYFVCRNPFVQDLEHINPEYAKEIVALARRGMQVATTGTTSTDYRTQHCKFRIGLKVLLEEGRVDLLSDFFLGCRSSCLSTSSLDSIKSMLTKEPNLVPLTLEALNHLTMPHEVETPSKERVKILIDSVVRDVVCHYAATKRPFLITIARSTNDGFCPNQLVESIQEQLLHQLQNAMMEDCHLRVVRDYGEWEGSTLD